LTSRREEFGGPIMDGRLHFRQMPFKEMVATLHNHHLLGLGCKFNDFSETLRRTILVARSAHEQFGRSAISEKLIVIDATFHADRRSQPDQPGYACVRTRDPQAGGGAKRESAEDDRQLKLGMEPVERCPYIFLLALSL